MLTLIWGFPLADRLFLKINHMVRWVDICLGHHPEHSHIKVTLHLFFCGLSPRGWGHPPFGPRITFESGSIPAAERVRLCGGTVLQNDSNQDVPVILSQRKSHGTVSEADRTDPSVHERPPRQWHLGTGGRVKPSTGARRTRAPMPPFSHAFPATSMIPGRRASLHQVERLPYDRTARRPLDTRFTFRIF